jgi:hypothetical protein
MQYRLIRTDEANEDLAHLPGELVDLLADRIRNYLAEDIVGRSKKSQAPYPPGRVHSFSRECKGRIYHLHVLFIIGGGEDLGEDIIILRVIVSETPLPPHQRP